MLSIFDSCFGFFTLRNKIQWQNETNLKFRIWYVPRRWIEWLRWQKMTSFFRLFQQEWVQYLYLLLIIYFYWMPKTKIVYQIPFRCKLRKIQRQMNATLPIAIEQCRSWIAGRKLDKRNRMKFVFFLQMIAKIQPTKTPDKSFEIRFDLFIKRSIFNTTQTKILLDRLLAKQQTSLKNVYLHKSKQK